jgi:8-oxo-dGTP pyrophosphatase MutT (NUDIX family)
MLSRFVRNSMFEFEILAHGLYRPDQLDISYDPALAMPTTPEISEWIQALWQQKLVRAREKNIPLFDVPLFRLISVEAQPGGILHLVLGNTSYKEYVATRVHEFCQGRSRHELGNALAVCSVVETSDGHILLDKRQGVDVYAGRYHVIGGFFERQLDTTAASPDPFGAICREIREETGIQLADIAEQYCLGAVYDLTTPHGELCFLTRLKISLAEVYARTPEEDEIKQLRSLAVTAESLRGFLLENHGNISATGEPNLLLYGALRFGERWFEEVTEKIGS